MGKIGIIQTTIENLYVIEPTIYKDDSGYFMETYNQRDMCKYGLNMAFVQENQSMSTKGVLRGLHFQNKYPQGKLVRVIQGNVYDVAVDLRKGSSTFGKWFGIELSAKNKRQLYIPEGFAHGFYVCSDMAEICYKVTEFWHPDDEVGIAWNDTNLKINWPIKKDDKPKVLNKDSHFRSFSELML